MAQPQVGLDAAGFLLLAEAHLVKAIQTLCQTDAESLSDYMAGEAITRAVASTREALKLLKEKEEPSGWDLPENTDEWEQGYGRCPKCGTPWDIIRPGKGQPACECEEEPCKP